MEIRKDAFLAAIVAMGLGATACGSNDAQETPVEDPSTGDEQPMEEPMPEPEPEPEPAPAPMPEEPVAAEEYAPVTE